MKSRAEHFRRTISEKSGPAWADLGAAVTCFLLRRRAKGRTASIWRGSAGRGMLRTRDRTTLTWSLGGQKSGSIGILVQTDGLRLMYAVGAHDGTKINVDELVPFAHITTQFGGRRRWLECIKCGGACRKLYGGRYFRCRQCHGLKYAYQSEDPAQRAMNRADWIANRLHDMSRGTTRDDWDFPPKPPRMRWSTYQRLLKQYDELQDLWGHRHDEHVEPFQRAAGAALMEWRTPNLL